MIDKRTKIVATVGPASDSIETIEALAKEGVNVFRLNFSHGTHEYHKSTLDKVREIEKRLGFRLGVLHDICGPRIRGRKASKFRLSQKQEITYCPQRRYIGVQIAPMSIT